jgi:hypothetical protein
MRLVGAETDVTASRIAENLHFHDMGSAIICFRWPAAALAQECLAPRADSVDSDIVGISLNFNGIGRRAINQGDLQSAALEGASQAQAHEPAADNRNIERRQGKNSC